MTFSEYFWKLCIRPYKIVEDALTNTIRLAWGVIGGVCNRIKADVLFCRDQFHWHRASWWALEKHGAALDYRRLDNEGFENYRTRLLAARTVFAQGGTEPGMLLAFELLGMPNAYIVEHYWFIGRSEWAIFSVIVPRAEYLASGMDHRQLDAVIWRYKPAHTLGKVRRGCFYCDDPNSLTDRDWLCN